MFPSLGIFKNGEFLKYEGTRVVIFYNYHRYFGFESKFRMQFNGYAIIPFYVSEFLFQVKIPSNTITSSIFLLYESNRFLTRFTIILTDQIYYTYLPS